MWSVPSITIPVGASQASVALVGLAATTAPVIGLASSSAGSDSLAVTVDSVHAGIALPHGGDLLVGDTLRTHVVLDRPAPAGGLVLQVQSSDSARVRIAPSDGTGFLDDGACILCVSVRDTAAAVTAPAGTATVTIPAGQLSAQIAVVALGASTNAPDVTVRVSGAQLAGTSVLVRPTPRKLPTLTCASGGTLPCELPVGHMLRLFGTLNTITRQPVVVRFRSLTPNLLGVRDSTATILLGDNALYTGEGTLIGKARGTGLVEVRANGFPVDTLHVPVTDSLTVRASWGYGAGWTGPRAVGTRWDEWVALGYEAALSASPTFVSGPPVLNATTVTVISRAPAVVSPIVSRREIPAGHSDVMMSFEAKSPGSAWVVMSAPGYRSDSVLYTVDGPAGMQLSAESAAPKLSSTVYLYRSSSNGFDARTQAVVYSLTVSDTSAVRVLTPTVVLPVGEWQAVGFVQARTAMPASPVTLTASAPGQPTLTTTLDIHTPALVLGPTPVDPWADSASYQVPVWPANGQAVVMPVADTVIATLRSSDPTVLLVTDSLVRMV
ncbi:MAG: hypothetical protein EBT79_13555, partial [Actinobacteria bacterium]|nr:hypothetical protein [Actinomycetota bacterium]